MFKECSSLTTFNLSSFNTQNVKYIEFIFSKFSTSATLNLFTFNTQNVNYLNGMFNKSSLTTLNIHLIPKKLMVWNICSMNE